MSSRNLRKVFGTVTLPSPDTSDDDFEPQCARPMQSSAFKELAPSSRPESPHDSSIDKIEEEGACAAKSLKKKKKKKRNKSKYSKNASLSKDNHDELDEIDRSVMEVNALLGSPTTSTAPLVEPRMDPRVRLMSIQNKNLNLKNEIRKFFGSDDRREQMRWRRESQGARQLRNVIVNIPHRSFYFYGYGLSMSIQSRDGNITYFTYDHNEQYQHYQKCFLRVLPYGSVNLLLSKERIQTYMHVEGMLQVVDILFMMEEYDEAELLLEKSIACLQYTTHPNFCLGDRDVRLEYRFMENRPFFIAILKYIYLLSNKSYHRTALELAKLLLNLDPSDPLKMFLIIDILALRACEYQWLVDVIDVLGGIQNHPELLVNLKYSYALARFQVAQKCQDSNIDLDKMLQDVILHCPIVAKALLYRFSGISKKHLENHPLFDRLALKHTGPKFMQLVTLYARMVYANWLEPKVLKWFMKNVNHLVDTFSPEMEAIVIEKTKESSHLFNTWPSEVVRHMTVIKSMSELISDGAVPPVKRGCAYNPVPPLGSIDRYRYCRFFKKPDHNETSIWHEFFSSAIPTNATISGVRSHWFTLRNTIEYLFNTGVNSLHIDETQYMLVLGTLIIFSMCFLLISVSLITLLPEIYGDSKENISYLEEDMELD